MPPHLPPLLGSEQGQFKILRTDRKAKPLGDREKRTPDGPLRSQLV